MTGNPPSYDEDHPPPQWARLYRNEEAELPAESDGSEVVDFAAANQQYDHLGPVGRKTPLSFSEGISPGSSHTMTEYLPEKHIYMIQFLPGVEDDIVIDDVGIQRWDSFIEILKQLRQQMIDEFNCYFWICYHTYDVMTHNLNDEITDRQNESYPSGPNAPYFEWEQLGFVPVSRVGTAYDLPDFCCVIEGPAETNLGQGDISSATSAVLALGGPGLENGRTALGIVNSYPTYNTVDGTGVLDYVWNPASGPGTSFTTTGHYQTFVPDRNSTVTDGSGQTDIDQADTKPFKVDFSGRGSGTNQDILDIDPDAYTIGDDIDFSSALSVNDFGVKGADGPLHPQYWPYPHAWKNYWTYYSEPYYNYPLIGDKTSPTQGYPDINTDPDPEEVELTFWRGYAGWLDTSTGHLGYSGSPYYKWNAREGVYVDIDVELNFADSPNVRSWNKRNNFDGFVGEPPSLTGVGALSGNPFNDANNTRETRSNPKGPVLGAQIIWRDYMGGEPFRLRCKGTKDIVAVDAGNWLDARQDVAGPGDSPVFPGTVTRPTVILTWDTKWEVMDGSWSPLVPNSTLDAGPVALWDQLPGTSVGRTRYTSSDNFVRSGRMQMWEVRWAFDEATLKAGGGNSILTIQTTTTNAPENTAQGASSIGGNLAGPFNGARIPVSHGRDEPTEIFFTVLEYNIKERNAFNGKMILQGKNSWPIFGWISGFWPYKDQFPRYGLTWNQAPIPAGSFQMSKTRNMQDWVNVKHEADDISVTSTIIGADPAA